MFPRDLIPIFFLISFFIRAFYFGAGLCTEFPTISNNCVSHVEVIIHDKNRARSSEYDCVISI
jgi:hypothetical protein